MTYTPKPGDRVTSPLLVGEWEVERDYANTQRITKVRQGDAVAFVSYDDVTPVAPPLPPEPPVGSVVWTGARYWIRGSDGTWFSPGLEFWQTWERLATAPDLSPVVAVEDVAEYVQKMDGIGDCAYVAAESIRDEFGGWGK